MGRYCFDIESTGFLDDSTVDYNASPWKLKDDFKIHCIVATNIDTEESFDFVQEECYTKFRPWVKENVDVIIAHNQINYDLMVCLAALGMEYTLGFEGESSTLDGKPVEIIDTYVLSKTLFPDRAGHSIEYFGSILGEEKIDWRAKAVELGLIEHNAPKGAEFKKYHPEMLVYNRRDVSVNIRTYKYLMKEWGEWGWGSAFELEQYVAWIIARQQHRGFWFDKELAVKNVQELDEMMAKHKEIVEPHLPPKPMGKTKLKDFTPPATQFKKDGATSAHIEKWVAKHEGVIEKTEEGYIATLYNKQWKLPITEPVVTEEPASINDSTFIKEFLVKLGWNPSNVKEKDLTLDSKKKKLTKEKFVATVDRYVEQTFNSAFCDIRLEKLNANRNNLRDKLLKHDLNKPLKVLTNPTFTVGQEKQIDPALEEMKSTFPYVQNIVEYLTYNHRRNSILGGGFDLDEEDEAETGFLPNVRSDGRIPTPADTCGASTGRMKHRLVCNIPRVTSLYGEPIRALFGIGDEKKYIQYAYDFASLEAMIESHYCVPMHAQALTRTGWKNYNQLVIGEDILGYNPDTGEKEWTPLEGLVYYENSLTYNLEWKSHKYRATGDHRWYVKQRDTGSKDFKKQVRNTLELNTGSKIIVNAPFNSYQDIKNSPESLMKGKWNIDWTARVLAMSQEQRKAFLEGFLIADGYWHEHKQKPVWRWAQNRNELFEAALTASYLVHDGSITVADNSGSSEVKVVTLCNNSEITGQRLKRSVYGVEPTWCPQTKLKTWVMRQGDCITITGNCWRYDRTEDKEYCNSLTQEKPRDIHTRTATKIADIIGQAFTRPNAKAVKYCCSYGGQGPKVAKTVGCEPYLGQKIFDAFWDAAKPLAELKEALTRYWETVGQKKFILGIDGRKIMSRSKHSLVNALFQGAGVTCAKRSMVYQDIEFRKRGIAVDFWKEDWKNKDYVQQLIAYHK